MSTICGANCEGCQFKNKCRGCEQTCGKPFGGTCVAAEYIKFGGREKYDEFKKILLEEINALLNTMECPAAETLYELPGFFVNLTYTLPNGKPVQFLEDNNIYLGAQIELAESEICLGVVADTTFILLCSYGENGSGPELILYKKR
ncbi:MAG: DUF3795 domain-containing protein [Oscillospiraceae bacterium]|nr:DUF3795 domain-containing protein [Oscillospiraceae bacterium]